MSTAAELLAAARQLEALGLNQGTAGNLSVRSGDGLWITPSALPLEGLAPEDMVYLGLDGRPQGRHRPSSEWRFHRDILAARPEVGAVVHSHAPYATTLACQRRPVPAFHYMVALAGGHDIRCSDYATFGTQALSEAALRALAGRRACLLANHGMIALGTDLPAALDLAREVEYLCRLYHQTLQTGRPRLLDREEMDRVQVRFQDYRRH
ncbi:class II aldolase/adducin family protein [Alkalilimnicola ehrlichii]|uniref:class II aldolase/adducin family protein n=1 Tax=Alkalilimnicola ehrlichii TaxID=351052 RepID=UPI003BA287CA